MQIVEKQREYFNANYTRSIQSRKNALIKLKEMIKHYEDDILEALKADLGKSTFEGYTTEIGILYDSIDHMMKHLKKWTKPKKVKTPIHQHLSKSWTVLEPYGVVFIIGPFNYPFQLLIEPLIGAIAAGNTAILKPSESTPKVEAIVDKIITETFDEEYISVIHGGKELVQAVIKSPVDYIFFTGSVPTGSKIMALAAESLTPLTLELGGKSPVIIDESANLEIAAKRVTWGKWMNAGQTCVAPDYVYIHESIHDDFIKKLRKTINEFYPTGMDSKDYGKIVNKRAFSRLKELIPQNQTVIGGNYNEKELKIEPTVLTNISWNDAIMADEIFGPILPVIQYSDFHKTVDLIQRKGKPLAAYIFSENEEHQNYFTTNIAFGGGCINDTVSHVANPYLPFGGVGSSGIGRYHGESSIKCFSHEKSLLKKTTKFDLSMIYPPYKHQLKLIKKIMK